MRNSNYSLFFKINLPITTILFILFLQYNQNYSAIGLLSVLFGAISTAVTVYALLYIVLFLFSSTKKVILYFGALLFTLVNIALIVDFFIFRLYKFHINAMVLNILTSPDAMDSIQIGVFPLLLFIALIIGFILFEFYIIKKLLKTDERQKYALNQKLNRLITIPIIAIIFSEKIGYGLLSLFSQNKIVSKFQVIPLYQPLTFSKLATRYFGFKIEEEAKNIIPQKGLLNYPLSNLRLKEHPNKINIFIFASDAVKGSIISHQVTPNIEKFKKDSINFENHYSGGNATRFGIFSLMYGLNSTYWFSFLDANRGSILFDVLCQLGYDISIISSTNTNWPEFRRTCYVNIQDSIKDHHKGEPWEKDEQSKNEFLAKVDSYDKRRPIFSFLFFDAPHGYSSPKEFNPFHASDKDINYLTVDKDGRDIKSIFAQYKNAVAYNDKLFGEMIAKLKEKGLYNNSLIIYTSDHGQEFYEYGSFGHNSSFSKGQTVTPMIIKLPDNLKDKIELPSKFPNILTSHSDIAPTLLKLIGLENNSSDYSNGKNIFDKSFDREFVFCANWNHNAIIDNNYTYLFSNLPNKMFKSRVKENSTYKTVDDVKIDSKKVLTIMNENRKFLK
ncbi:Predicted hydrolase [hydrothermal vent metagenome]|uniref:Predicted hydrolase n=1 Tax=hydrothermal vent metagenome TaxID=652676 RepID=A0A1W1CLA0_9ZZZZ